MTKPEQIAGSEREAIVAWLRTESRRHQRTAKEYRDDGDEDSDNACLNRALTHLDIAAAIERVDHLQAENPNAR